MQGAKPKALECCCRPGWVNAGCKQHGLHSMGQPGERRHDDDSSGWRVKPKPTLEDIDRSFRKWGAQGW